MSMFEIVFPDVHRRERLGMLLALIGEPREPLLALRLRDGWVEKDGDRPILCIYTRNGGGNREHYHEGDFEGCTACAGEKATEHPSYLSDADDGFDSTYRTYRFKVGNPDVTPDIIATLMEAAEDEPVDMSANWLMAIGAMSMRAEERS